jgi:putative membrane protein
MQQVTAYLTHLALSAALLAAFFFIYVKFTPYDEVELIRKGNRAAARSLCGALIGFCLTLASSILHNDTVMVFMAWAGGGMVVQLGVYVLLAHTIARVDQAIIDDNEAMGTLLGGVSVAVGIINAACMS